MNEIYEQELRLAETIQAEVNQALNQGKIVGIYKIENENYILDFKSVSLDNDKYALLINDSVNQRIAGIVFKSSQIPDSQYLEKNLYFSNYLDSYTLNLNKENYCYYYYDHHYHSNKQNIAYCTYAIISNGKEGKFCPYGRPSETLDSKEVFYHKNTFFKDQSGNQYFLPIYIERSVGDYNEHYLVGENKLISSELTPIQAQAGELNKAIEFYNKEFNHLLEEFEPNFAKPITPKFEIAATSIYPSYPSDHSNSVSLTDAIKELHQVKEVNTKLANQNDSLKKIITELMADPELNKKVLEALIKAKNINKQKNEEKEKPDDRRGGNSL
ncbi:MAG TPA: hypothetical protein PL158_13265 [Bacillota bacterium]|nr:hypothetical protein [Bacillota bacterium]HOL09307.1 hypothetical protein [Bacillota bacterium]